MTAPGGGGDRLEVPVVVDATGVARGLQREVDARVKDIRARITAEVDSKRLQAQAAAAARRVEQTTRSALKVGVDARYLKESIRGALAQIGSGEYRVKVGVDVDSGQLTTALAQVQNASDTSIKVDVDVDDADVDTARDKVRDYGRESRRTGIESARALASISRIGLAAGGVQLLASAVVGLGAGLVSVAGAASQAVGALAALPNLAGIAVQAGGALLAGFSGISDAVTAMGKVPAGGGGGGGAAAAKAQEAAQRRIADARQRVADVTEAGARRVQRAEEALAASQGRVQAAQLSLNRAREQAREKLEDYQLSLAGAALDEEAATLAVERARERWNEVMRSPISTRLDRAEADLALRQAEQRLEEVKESNDDLQGEASQAIAAGIQGSAEVVAAQNDIADANADVADAERDLAEERRDAARDLTDAQQDLADAIRAAGDAGATAAGGGVNALAQAMDKLSPAGRNFARFINDVLKPRLIDFRNAIQQELMPPIQDAIEQLITPPPGGQSFLDVIQEGMVGTATELGLIADKASDLLASDLFKANTAEIMASNNRALASFGDTGINMVAILSDVAVAAGNLVEEFAAWTAEITGGWRETVRANAENGKLAGFFERAGARAKQLGRIVGNLGRTLFRIGQAGTEAGDSLLDSLDRVTQRWEDWTGSPEGQTRMREFFTAMAPLTEKLGTLLASLAQTFVLMGENGGGSLGGLLDALNAMVTALNWLLASPLGPFVSALLTAAGAAGGVGLVASGLLRTATNIGKIGELAQKAIPGLGSATSAAGRLAASAARTAGSWAAAALRLALTWAGMAISATVNAARIAAVWAAQTAAATTRVALAWGVAAARVAASWAMMAVRAMANAARIAAVWVAQTVAATTRVLIQWGIAVAAVVAGWVRMGVQAMIQAARMAAAWLIAMGPIGWAIASVIGLSAIIISNWDWIKEKTVSVFGAIADFVSGIWRGLGNGLRSAVNGIIGLFNGMAVGSINVLIRGVNQLPGVEIPQLPRIPYLAEGAIIRRPTVAMVGEDGPEAVIPLSASRAGRRDELMNQAGLSSMPRRGSGTHDRGGRWRDRTTGSNFSGADEGVLTGRGVAALGGWGALDRLNGGRSLASVMSAPAARESAPAQPVGTMIAEGAITQVIHNPRPETPGETLNARLRRLAAVGIFDSQPGGR